MKKLGPTILLSYLLSAQWAYSNTQDQACHAYDLQKQQSEACQADIAAVQSQPLEGSNNSLNDLQARDWLYQKVQYLQDISHLEAKHGKWSKDYLKTGNVFLDKEDLTGPISDHAAFEQIAFANKEKIEKRTNDVAFKINQLKEKFKILFVLNKQIDIVTKRLNVISLNHFTPWKDEGPELQAALQRSRQILLLSAPELVSEKIEVLIAKANTNNDNEAALDGENVFSKYVDEKDFKNSLITGFQEKIDLNTERVDEIEKMKIELLASHNLSSEKLIESFVKKYPDLMADISSVGLIERDFENPYIQSSCALKDRVLKEEKAKQRVQLYMNLGEIFIPMLAGGLLRSVKLADTFIQSARGLDLAKKMTLPQKLARTSSIGFEGLVFSNAMKQLNEKKETCEHIQANFYIGPSEQNFQLFQECQGNYALEVFLASIPGVSLTLNSISKNAYNTFFKSASKLLPGNKIFYSKDEFYSWHDAKKSVLKFSQQKMDSSIGGVVFIGHGTRESIDFEALGLDRFSSMGNRFWRRTHVLDLKNGKRFKDDVEQALPADYLSHVSETYNNHPSNTLHSDQIAAWLDASLNNGEMSRRTIAIINTKIETDEITGGVNIVKSANKSEKLPVELEVAGMDIPRVEGEKIVEFVRLTSNRKDGTEMVDLMELALTYVTGDPSITTAVMFSNVSLIQHYKKFLQFYTNVPVNDFVHHIKNVGASDAVYTIDLKRLFENLNIPLVNLPFTGSVPDRLNTQAATPKL